MFTAKHLTERQSDVLLARISEQAERYPEMVSHMKKVATKYKTLTVDERNLLSVAYKNVIGTGRASWRLVLSLENKEESRGNERRLELVREYKQKIEKELDTLCQEVLELCKDTLLENASDDESRVFYHKMAGDYDRYLAEFTKDERRAEVAQAAHDEYRQATAIAQSALSPTHPIRLGLALNFSVFFYEILNSASRACILAKQAFDDAIAELDSLPEELYRDSTLIMQLLRDNLTFWQGDLNDSETKTRDESIPAATEPSAAEPSAAEPSTAEPAAKPAADAVVDTEMTPADAEPQEASQKGQTGAAAAAAADAAAVDAPAKE